MSLLQPVAALAGGSLAGPDRMPSGFPLRALPLYFFIHIPKTGGTSLKDVLNALFCGYVCDHDSLLAEVGDHFAMYDLLEREPDLLGRYLAVVGHMNLANPLMVRAERRKVYLSLVRSPLARVVSLYDWLRRAVDHPDHAEVREATMLQAFRRNGQFRRLATNEQLNQVFGTAEPAGIAEALRSRNYVIGRTERLEPFLRALEAVTGLRNLMPMPQLNLSDRRDGMELAIEQPDFLEACAEIREANRAEIEFIQAMPDVLVTTALAPE